MLLLLDARLRVQWGKLLGAYLIWYGLGRSVFESIRLDPSELFLGIRVNVWAAWCAVLVGIVIILVQRARHTGAEPGPYVPGREWRPEAGVDSEAVYTETDDDGKGADLVSATTGSSPATSESAARS